ncbi:unnamed protein product [Heligmosomoides polygyrus]|uniref:CNH domain-containing protein n=1 Tax=Heligmosomoides polygyrus TaxID=6339 RepID=A0A183G8S4_HELPZ|nr:unnamed protein product [Heligmosomoides polygyrus]
MSVPPRCVTGNCSLLQAKLITDIRVQATGPSVRPVNGDPSTWLMTLTKTRVATLNVGYVDGPLVRVGRSAGAKTSRLMCGTGDEVVLLCHGGFGYGARDADGERILEYADSHNIIIANTVFRKRDTHLVSFYSGSTKIEIDFILLKHRDRKLVTDAKVVPYETAATQHRYTLLSRPSEAKACRLMRSTENQEVAVEGKRYCFCFPYSVTDETWKNATDTILQVACSELGMTKPGRRKIKKLWSNDVREIVRGKKKLYHAFLCDKTSDKWRLYQEAKKAANKAVAVEKAVHYDDLSDKLEMVNDIFIDLPRRVIVRPRNSWASTMRMATY